jgi:hypothetical protein
LEPPGVLVEENKRRKLLQELGVEMRKAGAGNNAAVKTEE